MFLAIILYFKFCVYIEMLRFAGWLRTLCVSISKKSACFNHCSCYMKKKCICTKSDFHCMLQWENVKLWQSKAEQIKLWYIRKLYFQSTFTAPLKQNFVKIILETTVCRNCMLLIILGVFLCCLFCKTIIYLGLCLKLPLS